MFRNGGRGTFRLRYHGPSISMSLENNLVIARLPGDAEALIESY